MGVVWSCAHAHWNTHAICLPFTRNRVSIEVGELLFCCEHDKEVETFDDLAGFRESPNANVRGVLSGLSSEMKFGGGCSYLDAELFDEGGSRRVFVRRKLFDYQESGDTTWSAVS